MPVFRKPGIFGPGLAGWAGVIAMCGYKWTWANAAARTAQAVTAANLGCFGFQQDIALPYMLIGTSPTRWGPLPDPSMGPERGAYAVPGSAGLFSITGATINVQAGTQTVRTIASTTRSTQLARQAAVSAAAAGSVGVYASNSNITTFMNVGGIRRRLTVMLSQVSANMRWFAGITAPIAFGVNADPATWLNTLGIGRSGPGDANVQLFHNDGAGTATKIDLGASFPAATANEGFEFEHYTFDGTSYGYQVTRINTGAVVSGTLGSDIPSATTLLSDVVYSTNNTDASAVALDISSLRIWQRMS